MTHQYVDQRVRGCGYTTYRLDNLVNEVDTRADLLVRVGDDKTMQVLLRIVRKRIRTGLPLFDTALPTNTNLRTTLPLHLLQTIPTWTNQQTNEVNLRELLDRDINFFRRTLRPLHLVVFDRGTEVRVVFHGTVDESDALFFELLAIADRASVSTTTMSIIRKGRGRRAVERGCRSMNSTIIERTHAYRSRSGGMKSLRRSFLLISSSRR